MKRNRILALLLAALLLLSTFAFAEELVDTDFTFTEEGEAEIEAAEPEEELPAEELPAEEDAEAKANKADFAFDESGTILYQYLGTSPSVVIDAKWGVKTIADGAFAENTTLKSVTIPDTVENIGEWAFYNCTALTSVKLPKSISLISEGAFYGCTKLSSITLPESIRAIDDSAFSLTGLKSVKIPKNVEYIGIGAFAGCNKLASVTFPRYLPVIDDGAFYACTALKSIDLPAWLLQIGEEAFAGCENLKSVKMGGCVNQIGEDAFAGIPINCKFSVYAWSLGEEFCYDNEFPYTYRKDYTLKPLAKEYNVNVGDNIAFDFFSDGMYIPKSTQWMYFDLMPYIENSYVLYGISSSGKVAKIYDSVVWAVGEGSATFTLQVRIKDYKGNVIVKKSASSKIKVSCPEKPTSVQISGDAKRMLAKGGSLTLRAAVEPSTASQDVTWKTSSDKVAMVNASGVVRGAGKGTATITATATYGKVKKSASVKVTVYDPADLTVAIPSDSTPVLYLGESGSLSSIVTPSEATCVWSSSSSKVLLIDPNSGVMQGVGEGTATVTLTAKLGKTTKKASVKVKVMDPKKPTDLFLLVPDGTLTLRPQETWYLDPIVMPMEANEYVNFEYSSSAPQYVSVSNGGRVTGELRGSATVTVTASSPDGKVKKKATVKVTVDGLIYPESD